MCLTPLRASPPWTYCPTHHAWQLRASEKVYITRYTQEITHPSTNQARYYLILVIEREPVFQRQLSRR